VPAPARRLATYADLLALPGDSKSEILGGEIVVQPSPTPAHQSTIAEIYAELRGPFQRGRGGPEGWWLSPSTALRDQGDKRSLYQHAGMPKYWLVDPLNRTLSVLRLVREGYVVELVLGERGPASVPPFDSAEIDLSAIFPPEASS